MGLRFFADQCVPTVVIEILCDAGYEVCCLRDYLPKFLSFIKLTLARLFLKI